MFFRRKKKKLESRPEDLRRQYRRKLAKKHGLGVKVHVLSESMPRPGQVLDASGGGAAIGFLLKRGPRLEVGERATLIFHALGREGELRVESRLINVLEHEGRSRYGFEFIDPTALFACCDPYYFKFFNRRGVVRVRPVFDGILKATLRWQQVNLEARVQNLSIHGVGLTVPQEMAETVLHAPDLRIDLAIPKAQRRIAWRLRPVHATPLGSSGLIFGALFDPERSATLKHEQEALQAYAEARAEEIARWEQAHGEEEP